MVPGTSNSQEAVAILETHGVDGTACMAAFEGTSDGIEHQLPPETVKALFADSFLAPIGPE
ncbi:MAG: hypothetical protein ACQESR_04875, partial [Planctomycetota bacterium]